MKLFSWKGQLLTLSEIAFQEGVAYSTLANKKRQLKDIALAVQAAHSVRRQKKSDAGRDESPQPKTPVSSFTKDESEAALQLFVHIMGTRNFDDMNFRKGDKRGEYLWDGERVRYRLMMDRVRSVFTAVFINSGIQLCRREYYV